MEKTKTANNQGVFRSLLSEFRILNYALEE